MKSLLKIGLLGCGVITQRILPGLLRILEDHDGVVVAGCDIVQNNVEAIATLADQPELERYTSLDDMLQRSKLDAILVATPIAHHHAHVSAGLRAGLHVYTHKTLAPNPEQCLELANSARSAKLSLAASPGQVLLPAYTRAAEIIRGGQLGTVMSIDASTEAAPHRFEPERADEAPPPDKPFSWEWYHRSAKGGGPLDDMLVYPLAFLTEVFGQPTAAAVRGRLVVTPIQWRDRTVTADTPDTYTGLVMFEDIPATVRASFSSNAGRVPWGMITIRGSEACLEIEKKNDLEYDLHITPNGHPTRTEAHNSWTPSEATRYGAKECHVLRDIREFLSAIRSERGVAGATAANAAKVSYALSLIKQSAAHDGDWVGERGQPR